MAAAEHRERPGGLQIHAVLLAVAQVPRRRRPHAQAGFAVGPAIQVQQLAVHFVLGMRCHRLHAPVIVETVFQAGESTLRRACP
ncbi:hypothetical protein G6F45_014260 [Rhizopus arrhizus]|nr:hypothetical protein G6F24_018018 [Rhizopus arrhizus]KAG1603692.1 hypothetical protein G6F45_014260 [Rhizopus arrhizus]